MCVRSQGHVTYYSGICLLFTSLGLYLFRGRGDNQSLVEDFQSG